MANNPYKPQKKKKKLKIDTKNMGVNIDKNEYYEIVLSNSAHPEKFRQPAAIIQVNPAGNSFSLDFGKLALYWILELSRY